MALNQKFSIFWTFTGHIAALNQNFGCILLFGATKCPEKYFCNLSVMSLIDYMVLVQFNIVFFWVSRDLQIANMFDTNPVLWDIMAVAAVGR